jgi:hypothetical protein
VYAKIIGSDKPKLLKTAILRGAGGAPIKDWENQNSP